MIFLHVCNKNIHIYDSANIPPGRQQSKMLSTIDKCGSKIDINSVFDCNLSPVWRQMAIKSSVSNDVLSTFLDNIGVFNLPPTQCEHIYK